MSTCQAIARTRAAWRGHAQWGSTGAGLGRGRRRRGTAAKGRRLGGPCMRRRSRLIRAVDLPGAPGPPSVVACLSAWRPTCTGRLGSPPRQPKTWGGEITPARPSTQNMGRRNCPATAGRSMPRPTRPPTQIPPPVPPCGPSSPRARRTRPSRPARLDAHRAAAAPARCSWPCLSRTCAATGTGTNRTQGRCSTALATRATAAGL